MRRTDLPEVQDYNHDLPGQMRRGRDISAQRAAESALRTSNQGTARRVGLGSSFAGLNKASIGLDTSAKLGDNLLASLQFDQDLKDKVFQNRMSRAGLSVEQEKAIADAERARLGAKAGMLGDFNRMAFDANKERYGRQTGEFGLKQQLFDSWYNRARQAQGMSNDMDQAT
jgi:hypothetical protein